MGPEAPARRRVDREGVRVLAGHNRRRYRIVVAAGLALAAAALPAGAAHAQCAEIDGEPVGPDDARDWRDPVEVRAGNEILVRGEGDGWISAIVWVGPTPLPLGVSNTGGEVPIDPGDFDWVGVGLYRIDVFGPGAGECTGTFWIEVTGRSPLTTVAGASGAVVAAGGLALAASAVRRGRRGRCAAGRGAVGGFLAGGAGLLLAQQFAVLPTTAVVGGLAVGLPTIAGGVAARLACAAPALRGAVTPVLDVPAVVAPGAVFDVRVGFAVPPALVAAARRRHEEVTVQVVPGTSTPVTGPLRRSIALDGQATDTIRLRAGREIGAAHVSALYAVGGQTVAIARRPLWVGEPAAATEPAAGAIVPFELPIRSSPADLELRATYAGPHAEHVLQWTAETPHRDRVAVPDTPITVDLGGEPAHFTAGILRGVAEGEGRPGLAELLLGAGRQIARTLGPEVVDLVRQAAAVTAPRPPRVLLLTEEAEVPWELVAVEPAAASGPPFLATQAVVGRWFLAPGTRSLPPPPAAGSDGRSVVAISSLPAAATEQRDLVDRFGFAPVAPTVAGVLDALERSGTVHVAAHGAWRREEGRALLEVDDGRISSTHVAGLRLLQHPFVFLNACDVATGVEGLGTPTGFPAELVFAGAAGCVLPLWPVNDAEAAAYASEFYSRLAAGTPPAVAVRELRTAAAFAGLTSSAAFAYQFVGHPDLAVVLQSGVGPHATVPAAA